MSLSRFCSLARLSILISQLAVAQILADLGLGPTTLAAALLHDTVEATDYTLDMVRNDFGDDVAELVDVLNPRVREDSLLLFFESSSCQHRSETLLPLGTARLDDDGARTRLRRQ